MLHENVCVAKVIKVDTGYKTRTICVRKIEMHTDKAIVLSLFPETETAIEKLRSYEFLGTYTNH
jgi:hypothetical protein